MIRILIMDDHAIVRRGLKQIVADASGMAITGEAASAQEALELVAKQEFDVVILDIAMPGQGGLDVLREIRTTKPHLKAIMLSIYPEEQYAIRSLRDGASAYLTKASPPEEITEAIRKVNAGHRYITPSLAEKLALYVENGSRSLPHEALSDRELQVLIRIGAGKRLQDIAVELNLSAKTVSTYRERLLRKMGMTSTAQLIRYALHSGLMD